MIKLKVGNLEIFDEFATVKNETVLEAAKIMKQKGVSDLILVDDRENPIGIILAVDIVFNVIAENKNPNNVKVSTIARKVKTFDANTAREEIFNYMMDSDVEMVPIVKKDGTLLGVCSIGDILIDFEKLK